MGTHGQAHGVYIFIAACFDDDLLDIAFYKTQLAFSYHY
jgi:hypothetical protein